MNRNGHLPLQSFRATLFLLLASLASLAQASDQGIAPTFLFTPALGDGTIYSSPEAALAGMNAYRIEIWGPDAPQATDVRPCDGKNWYNGKPDTWCYTDPGYEAPSAGIRMHWRCPAEAPRDVRKSLAPGPGMNANFLLYCELSRTQPPPPCDGNKCVGNPIQPNTRIKIQRDADLGVGTLRFERTYTSSTGEWRSNFSTSAWNLELNNLSDVASNPSPACFWGTLTVGSQTELRCLPYMSNSDVGRTGAADWMVHRSDGRSVGFSSNTGRSIDAATRESAHAVTSAGAFDGLVVYDGNDTVEFFDPGGRLTRRSQLNGAGVLLTYLTNTGQKIPSSAPACAGTSVGPGTVGRPSCVTDIITGRQLLFTYDAAGRLMSVTDASGQSVGYGYNGPTSSGTYPGLNALTSVTYPDLTQRVYHYNESSLTSGANLPRALTGITDESSSRYAYFGYDTSQSALSTSHANGIDAYTILPSQLRVTDALGRQFTYRSHTISKLASDGSSASRVVLPDSWRVPLASGNTELHSYDAEGNLTRYTNYRGVQTRYEYDLTRNYEIVRTDASGTTKARRTSTAWHPQWRLPVQVAEPKRMTWSIYNGQPDPTDGNTIATCAPSNALLDGQPIAVFCKRVQQSTTDESGANGFAAALVGSQRVWAYTYNEHGQVLTVDGPRDDVSDITTYTYYAADDTQFPKNYRKGDLHTVTNALGHTTTYNAYDGNGQPLIITDANGVVTTLTYDLRYRLTSRAVGSEQTAFEYWPTGLLKRTTLPDGTYLEYTYDVAHRLTDITDSEGNVIHYTLDLVGNRTREDVSDPSAALARTTQRVFDVLNRVYQQIGAAGTSNVTTTYGYDSNGNQTSIAAPLGRNTSQVYDELNRLTRVTDPMSGITRYGYNGLDQLISVTDPKGLVTSYVYNGLGDLEQQTSPDTGVTTNTHDSAGNLATSTDARNATAAHTYDALNRVATTSFTLGSTTDQTLTYSYDVGTHGKGRLTGVSDSNHSLSWAYDEQGRVLTAGQIVDSVSKATSYTYVNGLRQSMTTPSGQAITYGYTNGKITSVSVNGTVLVSDILHDPFGPVRQWTWSNGSLSARTFDQDGKVTQVDSAGLKTFSYDDAFRISSITDFNDSALTWTYGYDGLDRLASATKSGTTLGYTYDANGNRLTQSGSSPSTYAVSSGSNRLNSVTGATSRSYVYDNAGNTVSDGAVTFVYNNAGRMASSTKAGVTTTYTYNALGQRVKKSTNGVSRYFVYDEAGHLVGEYDGSGALIQEVVWLDDIPVATLRPNGAGIELFYIHTDHLNTPRRISHSSDNAIVWQWDSDPFGVAAANGDPDGDAQLFAFHLRFPGQYWDGETGLNYNYFRDYDSGTGRYIESDPIGLKGGINTYGYAVNRPMSLTDPRGLCPCWGGSWKVDAGDLTLSVAFGGYVSFGAVSFTCKSNPRTKCQAQVFCIGGGPIVGAGGILGAAGSVNGASYGRQLGGWSGWQVTGSVGPVSGQADNSGGWSMGGGLSAGAGVASIKCNTFSLNCQCACEK